MLLNTKNCLNGGGRYHVPRNMSNYVLLYALERSSNVYFRPSRLRITNVHSVAMQFPAPFFDCGLMIMDGTETRAAGEDLSDKSMAASVLERYQFGWSVLVVIIFVAARLWRLTASCLWFDEIFSVHAARHSWTSLTHFVAADIIHPPLFYILLKVWISIGGESLLWLRLFPALTSVLTIIPFFLLSRELRLRQSELNLALLLLAVNGYLIKYAQELRMYSLLLFFALCSLWLFVKFLNSRTPSKKLLFALFSINLLLVYTHYAGWMLVILEMAPLVSSRRGKLKPYLATLGALFLAYTPWIYKIVVAAEPGRGLGQNIGWIPRAYLSDLLDYFVLLNRPFLFSQSTADFLGNPLTTGIVVILFGIPLLLFCVRIFKPGINDKPARLQIARWLFVFSSAPALLAFALSWLLPYSTWGTRHLIIAAVPYSILAALALKSLRRDWIRTAVLLLLGCWFVLSGMLFTLRRPPVFIWCAWEQLARQALIGDQTTTGLTRVYTHEDLIAYHLWFAFDATANQRLKVVLVRNVPGVPNDPAYFLPRDFSDISTQDDVAPTDDNIWLAFRASKWNEASSPLKLWLGQGFQVDRVFSLKAQGQEAFLVELKRHQAS
jgi:hypothetical protein